MARHVGGTSARWRVGVDVGGTFTDVVATDDLGHTISCKLLSTPPAFDKGACEGVARALAMADVPGRAVSQVLHATTAATNAVLEGSGPPTALVTTRGFRDVLEIGRLRTPAIYDLRWVKPPPLVPRRRRIELTERTSSGGDTLLEPDLEGLSGPVEEVVAEGVSSIAVALINSYVNDAHERAVGEWMAERHPAVSVTLSSRIIREPGEYERTSTAVLNAYLQPIISDYIGCLRSGLSAVGVDASTFVMQSGGGMMSTGEAVQFPVRLLESGPAAGVLAAAGVARQTSTSTAIAFDMGGTTAKASLIENGTPVHATEFSVGSDVSTSSRLLRGGGYAVRLPVIDLAEIGAGGGSIAWVDEGGGLSVGPQSAGADPGPACYGRAGERATVTDANLILGYLSAEGLASGGVAARVDLAWSAIERDVAIPLDLTVTEAARAIHAVANQQMARVLRAVTTERGRALEQQKLIISGGSGGLHAAGLADTVGIATIIVPPRAGVLSAVGLLWAPLALTAAETVNRPLVAEAAGPVATQLAAMAAELRHRLAEGCLDLTASVTTCVLDLRYAGQASELGLQIQEEALDARAMTIVAQRFDAEHLATYGHAGHGQVEIVRAQVTVSLPAAEAPLKLDRHGPAPRTASTRSVSFGADAIKVPVVARASLVTPRWGPVLVDERDTTVVVPPGWMARLDGLDNIILERAA
jgi:N-methylhydantoinase A